MKIAAMEVFPLAYPEPHFRGTERCVTLVRISSDDGTSGWGEGISQFPEATLATCILLERGLAPLLVGANPLNVEVIWRRMLEHTYWYGREGVAAFAISAVDMALWDLKGKILGQPVSRLIGGQLKTSIPAMASIIFDMDDLNWTLKEFDGFRRDGYRIVKAGWGMRSDSVFGQDRVRDLQYVREIRQVIGDGIDLVVDTPGATGLWDVPTAIQRFRELEPFHLRWIEQPLLPQDLAGHARLRAAVTTPIGTGEDEWGPESYKHVIDSNGVDVVQIDPGRCLGLTGAREVIKMVEARNLKFSAHSWSSALNTAASLHLLATSSAGDTLDFKPHQSPMQHELVTDPWAQEEGNLELREAPGLGVNVDVAAVTRYRLQ
jgi:L-alanine-DL-glutamate epimerase-like enolase superfamily enzyme